jgi:hypothetical protein
VVVPIQLLATLIQRLSLIMVLVAIMDALIQGLAITSPMQLVMMVVVFLEMI